MKSWNGRFRGRLDPEALRFSSSLPFDQQLYREDIQGSLAHVAMLAERKIIPPKDAGRIRRGLQSLLRDLDTRKLRFTARASGGGRFVAEDIHMAIEHELIRRIGEVGGRLHTARSRNDQVALDERLYLRKRIREIHAGTVLLQKTLLAKAERYKRVIMPGYTHLQRAQPILLAHHLIAYISMLERDKERFQDCLRRVERSPLGAGAFAGTSFRIDRRSVARRLGFRDIIANSIDAVSDRDVQIEFIAACAILMMHLSRCAEELVLWSSEEWNFVEIGDAFTTGSSLMPQKKNPDMAELIRGKTGRVYGDLMALLTVMKGLPLAYNRDLQEDKEALFDAADTAGSCLDIAARMLATATFNATRFVERRGSDFLLATEIADYLVRKGLPFRKAHAITGAVVQRCLEKNVLLRELPLTEYRRHAPQFANDLFRILDPRASVELKKSEGSTSPREVARALRSWRVRLHSTPRKTAKR